MCSHAQLAGLTWTDGSGYIAAAYRHSGRLLLRSFSFFCHSILPPPNGPHFAVINSNVVCVGRERFFFQA